MSAETMVLLWSMKEKHNPDSKFKLYFDTLPEVFNTGQGEPLSNPERCKRLVGKLNYLTVTRPNISFPVSVVSQFMTSPCDSHWDAVVCTLRYIKSAPGKGLLYEDQGHEHITGYTDADWAGSPSDRRSTSGYCVLVGGNLVLWKSKKQSVVARSSAESECRVMAAATGELVWIKQLLGKLKFGEIDQMELVSIMVQFYALYDILLVVLYYTGLSFGMEAIMALDGTLLLEEIVQAKEHLRAQYDELFPSLCNDHPDVFPPEQYRWEQFLWACELWYSNSMKIMFTDGKLRTCLIPIAGFLNHSTCPHIMHYGKVDSTTNSIKFPLSRSCNAGQQCFLGYGSFSSSHLLTFYGFLPQLDNYYDVIPLDIDVASNEDCADTDPTPDWTSHMVRGTWFSKNHGIFHYGLPPPLLDRMRRSRNPSLQSMTLTPKNLEIELEILRDLCSMFEEMRDGLGDPELDNRETTSWDVKLAVDFKDLQRRIFSSIVASCQAGCELVKCEMQRYTL
ncbi:hypothetical protein MTR67_007408 [Solanum verrucosum]|uniref:SET domain-containing protein n=1 Tax=Solanum verrucosum TaxID=315347 RepID=A0AAF0PZR5_SOLVR|nr:hypothetical protein MTR67_007408 [Solanum verrucosum]